jgi:hypothetical protein
MCSYFLEKITEIREILAEYKGGFTESVKLEENLKAIEGFFAGQVIAEMIDKGEITSPDDIKILRNRYEPKAS